MAEETIIHPNAIVDKGAELGVGVKIGAYAIVGPKVKLHDNVTLLDHAMVRGRTTIGRGTKIWPFASIGTEPQDLKYRGEDAELECGENNMFREYSNISIGTEDGGGKTVVGSGNLLMVSAHIAHDCIVGNNSVFANNVSIAGHVEIDDHCIFGGHSAVHQFCKIGSLAMVSGGAMVTKDVLPYVTMHGNRAEAAGLNLVGLKRAGLSSEEIRDVKNMYKLIFRADISFEEAVHSIEKDISDSLHKQRILEFIQKSTRGLR